MALLTFYDQLTTRLRASGDWLWPLALRMVMFWEFWESGIMKLNGDNWFGSIQENFPFPFNHISAELNWFAATWGELVFAVMLLFGLFTRFAAFSLIIISVVATAAVHWPGEWGSLAELWKGYAISNKGFGNFKLPLLFVLMLLPLVFYGGGKLSLDTLMLKVSGRANAVEDRSSDLEAYGLMLVVPGVALLFLIPVAGIVLLISGLALVGVNRLRG